MNTQCHLYCVSSKLKQALEGASDAQSFFSFNGRCHLLLIYKSAEKIRLAKVLELCSEGNIITQNEIELNMEEQDQKVAYEAILRNKYGDLL